MHNRLALYYLNAVSKGYQRANLDLKRKMKMVSMNVVMSKLRFHLFSIFPVFRTVKHMTVCFNTLGTRRREEPQEQQGQH